MVEYLRGFYSALMKPGALLLSWLKVSPDVVTVVGTLLTVVAALVLIPGGWLWQGALILGVLVLSDGLDGELARMTGKTTAFGAFLDSSLDRLGDAALFGAIVIHFAMREQSLTWAIIAVWTLAMGQLTSYVKARAEALGYSCRGGIAARGDRILIILVATLLAGLGVPWALEIGTVALAVASTITVMQRMVHVRRQAAEPSVSLLD